MKAKQIVILTENSGISSIQPLDKDMEKYDNDEAENVDSKNSENLLDAKTIFKYNIIKKKNPGVNVVTELINQENLAYLLDNPLLYHFMREFEYDQTPVFASGEVYLSSIMDSLVCQAYYNHELITVIKQLIGEHKKSSTSGSQKRIKSQDTNFSHVPTSNLYHIKVPKKYIGKKYLNLFDVLTTRMFMIPLGLYRTVDVNLRAYKDQLSKGLEISKDIQVEKHPKDTCMKRIKYVVTNPTEKTRLMPDDLVFVLAKSDPGDSDLWDNYSEKNKDMYDNNQNELMKNINEMMFKQKGNNRKKAHAGENNGGVGKNTI
jgi:hypothetical protein